MVTPLSENQRIEIINQNGCDPIPLIGYSQYSHRDKCLGGWVYDRKYGLIYVDFASHIFVMSYLLAFHKGYDDIDEMIEGEGLSTRYKFREWSDEYLRTYPSVYGSMAGGGFTMYKSKNTKLTELESDAFGVVTNIKV